MDQKTEDTKKRGISGEMTVVWAIIGSAIGVASVVALAFIALNGNINRVNDALLQTNATIAELAVKSATHNAEIRALIADVAANGAAIADLNNKVGDGEVRLGSIEQRLSDVDEMDDRLDDLEQVKMKNFCEHPLRFFRTPPTWCCSRKRAGNADDASPDDSISKKQTPEGVW